MLGHTTRIEPITCPYCGLVCDASTEMQTNSPGSGPKPGDLSLCIQCAEIGRWTDELQLEKLTAEEVQEIVKLDGGVAKAMIAVRMAHEKNGEGEWLRDEGS